MAALLLAARFIVGAALCLFALAKLASLPASPGRMWRPPGLGKGPMVGAVGTVAIAELGLGMMLAFGVLPLPATLAFCAAVALVVSVYGTLAILQTGRCGCGGPFGEKGARVRGLWARNLALFGGGGIAAVAGPTLGEVTSHRGELAPLLAMLPAAIVTGAIALRLGTGLFRGGASSPSRRARPMPASPRGADGRAHLVNRP